MTDVLRRLNVTEGQAYAMVIGLALAILLTATGIPAVLRDRPASATGTNRLNPRAEQTAAGTAAPPAIGAAVPAIPGIVARPGQTAVVPVGGAGDAPGLPPAVSGVATAVPTVLSITTFARVDHPGSPGGLAVARGGTVYVTTNNGTARGDSGASHVLAFDSAGVQTADRAIDGQAADHVNGLTGAAVDPITGAVAVLEPDRARVFSIDMSSGAQRVLTEIPDLPACLISLGALPCQQGAEDRAPFPVAAAYNAQGDLFVTDPSQDTIWRLRLGAQAPEVWQQSTYFTIGDGPYGLAVDGDAVEFTVGTSFDPAAPTSGGLYRVAINADGSAGALTLVAAFPRGAEPGPLAVGHTATAYVVLRATGTIVAITPAGAEAWRIDPPGAGTIPLDTPSALALMAGRLLVANQGTGADPAPWAVLAVSVNDGGRP